jgi:hypothetical protein
LNPLSNGGLGVGVASSNVWRAVPEPRSSLASWGRSLLQAGMTTAETLVGGAGNVLDVGSLTTLLQQQIQVQREMQVISMQSNIAKSQHEAEMAPVRNMRVG